MLCLILRSCRLGKSFLFLYDLIFIGSVSVSQGVEVEVVMKRGRARGTLRLQWSSLALRFNFLFLASMHDAAAQVSCQGRNGNCAFPRLDSRCESDRSRATQIHSHTLTTWACHSSSSLPVIDWMSSSRSYHFPTYRFKQSISGLSLQWT